MSMSIDIMCEDAESLLDDYPELSMEEVQFGSHVLAELLFPQLRLDHYRGPDGGLLADLSRMLGAPLSFLQLLQNDHARVEAKAILAEMKAVLAIPQDRSLHLPATFEVADADGSIFSELIRTDFRVECGYNHCMAFITETDRLIDLGTEKPTMPAGLPLTVIRKDVRAILEPELERIALVATTAIRFDRRIDLMAA